MTNDKLPDMFLSIREKHRKYFEAVETLGKTVKQEGPIDEKNAQLIQLAAAASIRSEGSVHSHTRRAIEAGATPDEICHSIILLTSIIGFPTVAAALSWVSDIIEKDRSKK